MQFKFKKGQLVKIKILPDWEYVEFNDTLDIDEAELKKKIKPGLKGKINVILPNGKYHVDIFDEDDQIIAYAPFDEDQIDKI